MAREGARWVDERGNIRHGSRPAIPVYRNKEMYGIAAAVLVIFLASFLHEPGLPDPCTLKETEYVSTFRGVGFIRKLADEAPDRPLRRPGLEPIVDFGGKHGCVPERLDADDVETMRVTRCSTTVCALARYFCGPGAEVPYAEYVGFSKLKARINDRWNSATAGQHPKYFYRLSLGVVEASKHDSRTDLNQVWLIAALGDGSFYWLQSFIIKYSLSTWLKEEGYYHLTREELFRLLDLVESLTNPKWTNDVGEKHYRELLVSMDDYWMVADTEAATMLKPQSRRFNPKVDILVAQWDTVCSLTDVCQRTTRPSSRPSKLRRSKENE